MTERTHGIPTIVITGGPCAGKTTILARLGQKLPEHGVRVITVPEAARELMSSGISPANVPSPLFQEAVLRMQMARENIFRSIAEQSSSGERTVMLCDRGAMDGKAYIDAAGFAGVLASLGTNVAELRDARYDAVIHLVTAANGAEEYYAQDDHRFEPLEYARDLDERTQHAWVGHAHLSVVDNSTDLDGKEHRALQQILHHLGMPVPLEIERKYLVPRDCLKFLPPHAEHIVIEQAYLRSDDPAVEVRIRRRSSNGSAVYFETKKQKLRSGVRTEHERQISREEFFQAMSRIELGAVIRKNRFCFLYDGQYFELDDFSPMGSNLCLLEIELTDETASVRMPPWITAIEDVTDNPAYSNRELALARA